MYKGEIKEIEGGLMCEATDTFFEYYCLNINSATTIKAL